jgi:photosystem II stability/assembly factor-like uncharacterized protein
MIKKIFTLSLVLLMAQSCSLLSGGGGVLGIVKTVDGGGVWQSSNIIEGENAGTINGLVVSELAFDPTNRETLYASSSNGGLWQSKDSAQTWKQILSQITIYDFFVDPNNTNRIYVAGTYNDHGKILRTDNGGASWDQIYNEGSIKNAVNTITANPYRTSELYAALNSGIIIKSQDSGVNWFVVYNVKDQVLKMRFSPLNGQLYVIAKGKGLARSNDGGQSWTSLTKLVSSDSSQALFQQSSRFVKFSLDDQDPRVIYMTTGNGLFKTTDDGLTWTSLKLPVRGESLSPRAIASSRGGVVAYTSIENTIYKTVNGGQSWQTQSLPTSNRVNSIIIDPVLPQIVYLGLISR